MTGAKTGGTPTSRNCDYFLVSWALVDDVTPPCVEAGAGEASGDPGSSGPCLDDRGGRG